MPIGEPDQAKVMSSPTLEGRSALVTGASQGIGLATAVALAQAGASVAFNYRVEPGEATQAVAQIERRRRPRDLVGWRRGRPADGRANGGRDGRRVWPPGHRSQQRGVQRPRIVLEADMAGFRRTLDVTMWGAFYLLRAAAQQMLAQQPRRRARRRLDRGDQFAARVHGGSALNGLQHGKSGHRPNGAHRRDRAGRAPDSRQHPDAGLDRHAGRAEVCQRRNDPRRGTKLPWQRLGRPDEIGRGVVFLCDPASDYITGSSLLIDGGITLPWWASRGSGVPE